jgi:hypothetical protein
MNSKTKLQVLIGIGLIGLLVGFLYVLAESYRAQVATSQVNDFITDKGYADIVSIENATPYLFEEGISISNVEVKQVEGVISINKIEILDVNLDDPLHGIPSNPSVRVKGIHIPLNVLLKDVHATEYKGRLKALNDAGFANGVNLDMFYSHSLSGRMMDTTLTFDVKDSIEGSIIFSLGSANRELFNQGVTLSEVINTQDVGIKRLALSLKDLPVTNGDAVSADFVSNIQSAKQVIEQTFTDRAKIIGLDVVNHVEDVLVKGSDLHIDIALNDPLTTNDLFALLFMGANPHGYFTMLMDKGLVVKTGL